jgi:hypothetical protein
MLNIIGGLLGRRARGSGGARRGGNRLDMLQYAAIFAIIGFLSAPSRCWWCPRRLRGRKSRFWPGKLAPRNSGPGCETALPYPLPMFLPFFDALRRARIPVSLREYLSLPRRRRGGARDL